MDLEILTFDPNGDIILSLEVINNDEGSPFKNPRNSSDVTPVNEASPVDTSPTNFEESGFALDDTPANDALIASAPEDEESSTIPSSTANDGKVTSLSTKKTIKRVEMRVSSKHLALASPIFMDMVADCSTSKDGSIEEEHTKIPLERDDRSALEILLNIIHGRTRNVPREVDGHMLWECVKLIEKYEFYEVAEIFTDMWYANLQRTIPRNARNDLGSWIFICFELRRSKDFKNVTRIATLETNCEFPLEQEERIHHWIIDKMQSCRQHLLSEVLSTLSRLLRLYEGPGSICRRSDECDALGLGKLIRGLKSAQLYPVPEPESLTISVKKLLDIIRKMDFTTSCRGFRQGSFTDFYDDESEPLPDCHLDKELHNSFARIEDRFQGLNLDEMRTDTKNCS